MEIGIRRKMVLIFIEFLRFFLWFFCKVGFVYNIIYDFVYCKKKRRIKFLDRDFYLIYFKD